MDTIQVELSLSGREIVMVSLLANLGVATLSQELEYGTSVLEFIATLDGAEDVAEAAMKKIQGAMELAALQAGPTNGMVS
jgi:hypothetical protein